MYRGRSRAEREILTGEAARRMSDNYDFVVTR